MNHLILFALILTLAWCVFEALFLLRRRDGRQWRAFALKGLAALCFLGVGLLLRYDTGGGELIVWGLLCGLIGDELLALRKIYPEHHDVTFVSGAIVFSVGHGFYIAYLLSLRSDLLLPAVPLFLLLVVGSELFARKTGFSKGSMHYPGLLYIAVEGAMCALALVHLIRVPGISAAFFAAGGILFFLSDNLLCAHGFGTWKTRAVNIWLHITYIAAQLLIAWSIFFLP